MTYLILNILEDFREGADVNDIYLGMYLREPSRLLYFVDPEKDPEYVCDPGDWEPVSEKEAEKFLNWDGSGMLYDVSKTEKYGWMCTAGVPLRGTNGEIQAFVLADVTLDEVEAGLKSFLIQYSIAMCITVNLFGYLLTRYMKKRLVDPINEIAEAAASYVQDRRSGEQVTDRFAMLNIRTGDEVENLSLVMADMERDLSDYMENLTRITAEKERIGTELALATRIQADMLPSIFPPFPDHTDIDIYASMDPAKEVGGDFYDFFLIDEDHLALVIADVSGKGVPAALFMMVSKILIQNYVLQGLSPKDVLAAVNEQICKNNREEMFVTAWLGILDLRTGDLTAANAGHEYPILKTPDGNYELVKDRHGFVIGGMEGMRYSEYRLHMDPGAKLFLYTDGAPEATNADEELFGVERTLHALNDDPDSDPRADIEAVDASIRQFVGEAPQFDDLTMLCVRYNGRQKPEGKTDT